MKTFLSAILTAACLLAVGTGCYSTVEGKSKMGMPFLRDRLESRYERTVEDVFAAAKEVLAFNGTLVGENTITKVLEAKVDNTTVWVKVDEVEPGITRVQTQARGKGSGSKISIASEIDKQIALQLQANP
ncbi:MAG: hypothetical protein KDM81_19415 [Verrucomicrobiae bacterium]|nr:hypothetical protein [Verrucomicrobiae bacterium]MCP5518657.1 hypothetical protein [Verrucomicrobiales bacterium]